MILDLSTIMAEKDDNERRRLLVIRGWQLQRSQSETEAERDLCDWFIARGWRHDG